MQAEKKTQQQQKKKQTKKLQLSFFRERQRSRPGPEVKKTFFMLSSAEDEISSANKYENANNSWHFHIY